MIMDLENRWVSIHLEDLLIALVLPQLLVDNQQLFARGSPGAELKKRRIALLTALFQQVGSRCRP